MHAKQVSLLLVSLYAWSSAFAQAHVQPVFAPDPDAPGAFIATQTFQHLSSGTFADHFDLVPPAAGSMTVRLQSGQPSGRSGVIFQGFELTGSLVDQQLVLFPDTPSNVTIGAFRIGAPADLLVGVVAAPSVAPRTPVSASYTAVFQLAPFSPVPAIPEPQAGVLLAAGLLALGVARWRHTVT